LVGPQESTESEILKELFKEATPQSGMWVSDTPSFGKRYIYIEREREREKERERDRESEGERERGMDGWGEGGGGGGR